MLHRARHQSLHPLLHAKFSSVCPGPKIATSILDLDSYCNAPFPLEMSRRGLQLRLLIIGDVRGQGAGPETDGPITGSPRENGQGHAAVGEDLVRKEPTHLRAGWVQGGVS